MRRMSLYLGYNIVDELQQYGHLDDVIGDIVDAVAEGELPLGIAHEVPRENGRVYHIIINNPEYESFVDSVGARNKHYSLRKLIYYVVDTGLLEEVAHHHHNTAKEVSKYERADGYILNIAHECSKLRRLDIDEISDLLSQLTLLIAKMHAEVKNGESVT